MRMLYWLASSKKNLWWCKISETRLKTQWSIHLVCICSLAPSLSPDPSPSLTMPLSPEYSELTCRKPDNSDATILEKSESESRSVMSDFLQPHGLYRILQARILEWVTFPFSRGIFPTQGSNPGLPHCRWILYQLSYQVSPLTILSLIKKKNHSQKQ